MEESEGKEKGFKVQDRRRFSAEGEARSEETEESAAAPEPPPPPPRQEATAKASAHAPNVEINFSMFLVSLSTQALAALGEMADPVTGKSDRDLEGARQLIDILGVLREKTRGNLDQDEKNLLEAILFDLRMKYVELAKPAVG
jgi:Domain of unknown function (DUF1844)